MGKKRFRKVRKREEKATPVAQVRTIEPKKEESKYTGFLNFYDKKYKALLIIPFIILFLAIGQIVVQTATTGEFVSRGVSLKGGTTITIPTSQAFDIEMLKQQLTTALPDYDLEVRILRTAGVQTAIVVEADIEENDDTNELVQKLEEFTGTESATYSIDVIGSSLGDSFFREIIKIMAIAFLFMGMVVFLYFGTEATPKWIAAPLTILTGIVLFLADNFIVYTIGFLLSCAIIYIYFKYSIPSIAVILAAFSDMIITIAVVNLLGIKLSTAGIAAFLMLIGYSIDTDILLSTRVLKRKGGSIFDRVVQSLKTGLTMNFSTLAAVLIVLIFSKSEILTQIMTILFIGLIIDLMNTWIQNVGILRMFLEK